MRSRSRSASCCTWDGARLVVFRQIIVNLVAELFRWATGAPRSGGPNLLLPLDRDGSGSSPVFSLETLESIGRWR
jgi:hypothetical protein